MSAEFTDHGNYAEACAVSTRIQTLDELLVAASVDTTVWRVDKWGVKKWEVGAKVRHSDLSIDHGIMTGWIKENGIGVQDLWSVWAKLVRIIPQPIVPLIQPVHCSVSHGYGVAMAPASDIVGTAVVLADWHIGFKWANGTLEPFHDRAALDLAVQLCQHVQPSTIFILGDVLDMTEFTDKYVRTPEYDKTVQPALIEAHWWLQRLRAVCPGSRIVLFEGNHEKRLPTTVAVHMRAAYGLRSSDVDTDVEPLSVEYLLGLQSLGIEWRGGYPTNPLWLTNNLRMWHGDVAISTPGATVHKIVDGELSDSIVGHAHRIESASRTIRTKTSTTHVSAHCVGCLCRIDGSVPGSRSDANWQQGMAVLHCTAQHYAISLVAIYRGVAICAGTVYTADSGVVGMLRSDVPQYEW